jgi:tetratricopeptide (TPR) repeat protein
MKQLMLCLFLALTVVGVTAAQSDTELIEAAAEAYEREDYARAAQLYENLLQRIPATGELHLNLGNSYFLSGDVGRALLNYRRAQMFLPRDSAVQENIAIVRARRMDFVETSAVGIIPAALESVQSNLTFAELFALFYLGWVSSSIGLSLYWLKHTWRKRLRLWMIVVFTLTTALAVILLSVWGWETHNPPGVVISSQVDVMSGPGTDYLKIDVIHAGSEFRVIERQGGWIRYWQANGEQGWIPTTTTEMIR